MPEKQYLFASYARPDIDRVRPIVGAIEHQLKLRELPVGIWMDLKDLRPGEQWDVAIGDALSSSVGFLLFISRRSLQSEWVGRELGFAAQSSDRLIIPIRLERGLEGLPDELRKRNGLDISDRLTPAEFEAAAAQVAEEVESYLKHHPGPGAVVSQAEAPLLAAGLAQQLRRDESPSTAGTDHSAVFVVHGHDHDALAVLEEFLSSVGIKPVVLSRQAALPQSLFQKFMSVAQKAQFAIVLLCGDDYGASRLQYDAPKVAEKALQFRARQNVILELGFFYGKLTFENVFVLYRKPDEVFPNFERPSDLDGVVFDALDQDWRQRLGAKLSAAGFNLPLASTLH